MSGQASPSLSPRPYLQSSDSQLRAVQGLAANSISPDISPVALPLLPDTQSSGPSRQPTTGHPGCVLCSLVASASSTFSHTALSPSTSPQPSPINASTHLYPHASLSAGTRQKPPSSWTSVLDGGKATAEGREIVYHDQEITVYPATGKESLCDGGRHLIVVVNDHLESVYDFVSPSWKPWCCSKGG